MPAIAPLSAPTEPTEPETDAVATETEPDAVECQCPHEPTCPAYSEPETYPDPETGEALETAPDHIGDPLPDYECCPAEVWLRIKTFDAGISEFNGLIGKLTAKKDLAGLYSAARALSDDIRGRMYPDPALRFADYTVGFLACLSVMASTGVLPLETIPPDEPKWDALLAEWAGVPV
jgi:hypothetical protein